MSTTKAVLITGATGKQGGAVIDALLKANADFEILALTRNAQSPSAKKLVSKSPKIKIITGDLDNIEAVFQKAKEATTLPIWGVFSVQVAIGNGASPLTEQRQGTALIDASLKHGVSHFVYSSIDRGGPELSPTTPTKVPHFASKHAIEQHLFQKAKGSDMSWTVIRPVAFFDNLTPDFFGKIFTTSWALRLRDDQKLQLIATSDIGIFGAEALVKYREYEGRSVSIAGDELTLGEFREIFEKKTGKKLPTTFRFVAWIVNKLVKELGLMYEWFRDVGYGADVQGLRKEFPDLKGFGRWVEEESEWRIR